LFMNPVDFFIRSFAIEHPIEKRIPEV